jgi:antitoxin component YwqK of YwqJK toxin-antitoxin module
VLAVSSDTTHDVVTLNPPGVVKERDIDYTVGTIDKDKNFHHDTSNDQPTITMNEKQTGGNDKPRTCTASTCSEKGTFEDQIHVAGPGKNFTTTQTYYINGKEATIYTMQDGKLISGTQVHVQATDKEVTVTYGP